MRKLTHSSRPGLKRGVAQRQAAKQTLQKLAQHHRQLVADARRLQKQLRAQTHRIINAQEEERRKLSRNLQDEVAQTLLGINVRLVALKKEAPINVQDLQKEIASTQRLVEDSVQSIDHSLESFTPKSRKTLRRHGQR